MALMDMFSRPEFWNWASGVGGGLSRAGRGQGYDISQANNQLFTAMKARKDQERLKGLMDQFNLNPQQRGLMGALPVQVQQQILAQQAFPQTGPMTDRQRAMQSVRPENRHAADRIFLGLDPRAGVPQKPTSGMREYELYRQQAEASGQQPMGFMDYRAALKRAGSTNVNVNTGDTGPEIGTIPQGWEAFKSPEGAWQMRPVAGGPAAVEAEAAMDQEAAKAETTARSTGVVIDSIDKVLESEPNWSVGFTGPALAAIPGTPAHDLANTLDTIKANVGFDKLQAMRNASATGGALGQVSERENLLLQRTLGSLEQSQSPEQFKANLKRLRELYLDIIHGPGNRPGQAEQPPQEQPVEMEKTLNGVRYIKRNGQWYQAQ